MIIVEGPDGSGKTGLITRLTERYADLRVGPRACTSDNGPVDNLRKWTSDDLTQWPDMSNGELGPQIRDRYPLISELIYGPVIRGQMAEGFNGSWLGWAMRSFYGQAPAIIYCLPARETVMRNVVKSHLLEAETRTPFKDAVARNIDTLYSLYYARASVDFGHSQRVNVWSYDAAVGEANFDRLCDWLEKAAGVR